MIHVDKACACVLDRGRILCFRHPLAGNQLPKGTVEPGEPLASAVLRELAEESGLNGARVVAAITRFERLVGGGPDERGPLERHTWHLFEIAAPPTPRSWRHLVRCAGVEDGMSFDYFWHDLAAPDEEFAPIFVQALAAVRAHVARGGPGQRQGFAGGRP